VFEWVRRSVLTKRTQNHEGNREHFMQLTRMHLLKVGDCFYLVHVVGQRVARFFHGAIYQNGGNIPNGLKIT
jgi:hypothetical protein